MSDSPENPTEVWVGLAYNQETEITMKLNLVSFFRKDVFYFRA